MHFGGILIFQPKICDNRANNTPIGNFIIVVYALYEGGTGNMKKAVRKILGLVLALVMAVGCLMDAPITAGAVDIGLPGGLVVDVTGTNITTGNQVYFGNHTSFGPILWRVVQNPGDGTITLFCDGNVGTLAYDYSGHQNWSGSSICGILNGTFFF